MKDSFLIDSELLVNFWAEIMDISNYVYNKISAKQNSPVFISEEAWT